jgi:hypothetical protein
LLAKGSTSFCAATSIPMVDPDAGTIPFDLRPEVSP